MSFPSKSPKTPCQYSLDSLVSSVIISADNPRAPEKEPAQAKLFVVKASLKEPYPPIESPAIKVFSRFLVILGKKRCMT